jgi:peptidoglycan hydrolase CwlO-like protein
MIAAKFGQTEERLNAFDSGFEHIKVDIERMSTRIGEVQPGDPELKNRVDQNHRDIGELEGKFNGKITEIARSIENSPTRGAA